MSTPVIIPAFKEASDIAQTLNRLPSHLVEPIVVVNGEPDGTAEIAREFGATVYEIPEQGKILAIQHALSTLSIERALSPLMILDADTRPVSPRRWHNRMVSIMNEHPGPVGVGGPMLYTECAPHEATLRTLRRMAYAGAESLGLEIGRRIQHGPNMALKMESTDVLDAVMEISNDWWPGEDRALADAIEDNGGEYHQTIHPEAFVVAPLSLSAVSLIERIKLGPVKTREKVAQRYADSGPPGAKPYQKAQSRLPQL